MKQTQLREHLFKLLYMSDFGGFDNPEKQAELYFDGLGVRVTEDDKTYLISRLEAILEKLPEIDGLISNVAVHWTLRRMSQVDLAILRLAYYEMQLDQNIPKKVAINEAVELAKKFGTAQSSKFVNGVLAKLY